MTTKVFTTKVAGVTFEGRQDIIAKLSGTEPCRIVPEPENAYDPNALAVQVAILPGEIQHVGYIPRDLASQIAPHLEGESVMVRISEITGGFELWNGETAAFGLLLTIEVPTEA